MDTLRRLIHEAHRRSLWQVLGLYAVGSWVVIQVVEVITDTAGLPDWTPGMALVLLLIGLPIVMATAFVQEGGPGRSDEPPAARVGERDAHPDPDAAGAPGRLERHLTWKRTLLGGAAALVLLAASAGGYLVLWSGGIGPVGSLVAQDLIEEGERIVLAGFESSEEDEDLAAMVTEALRIDLTQSEILSVLEPAEVRPALARMGRSPDDPFTGDVALELATREGVKAVLRGEIGQVGSGYVITASLVGAEDGRTLAAFRETAEDEDGVIDAVDRLSQDIREKAGESLRSIRRGEPLSRVTTASLPALRLYTRAVEASDAGDYGRAIELLEDAVERDPDFAMAWRKLGVNLNNSGIGGERADSALTRAYHLRDRLTERERYLAEAMYHSSVRNDPAEAIGAYEQLLELDPQDDWALNNISLLYMGERRYDEAVDAGYRGWRAGGTLAATNLVHNLVALGRLEEADSVLRSLDLPQGHRGAVLAGFALRHRQGRFTEADSLARMMLQDRGIPETARIQMHFARAAVALSAGRLDEAREHVGRAGGVATGIGAEVPSVLAAVTGPFVRIHLGLPQSGGEGEAILSLARRPDLGEQFGAQVRGGTFWLLAHAGDVERAREARELYRAGLPEEPSRNMRMEVLAQEGMVQLLEDAPSRALETLDRARVEGGCEDCFAVERARALRGVGRTEEAVRELESELEVLEVNPNWPIEAVVTEHATRAELAPLYEEVGDTAKALETYRWLADRWEGADPVLQPRVREWRERIAELGGG